MPELGVKPLPFKGDRDQTANFVAQFNNYVDLNSHLYDTDAKQISFFLSLCDYTSIAGTWANTIMKIRKDDALATKRNPNHLSKFQAIEDLTDVFTEYFGRSNDAVRARNKLRTLRHHGEYFDLAKFYTRFDHLALLSGYNEVSLIEAFKDAMRDKARQTIQMQGSLPKTLLEWKERLTEFENDKQMNKHG